MSELGNFIREQINQQDLPHFEMAARLGLSASHLSQIINGDRRGFNHETLSRMVEGISTKPEIRAKFQEAYFRDLCLPKFKKWVHVTPPGAATARVREEAASSHGDKAIDKLCDLLGELALPTDTVNDLRDIIAAVPHYSALHDLIRDLADFRRQALPVEHPVIEETLSPSQIAEKAVGPVSYSKSSRRRRPKKNGPEPKKSVR